LLKEQPTGMKLFKAVLTLSITVLFLFLLNNKWGSIPAFGKLLSPLHGYLNDPENRQQDSAEVISLTGLESESSVYFDDRMVPHIFAANDHDAFYIQGYLHAKDRLWQMEFQTRYAAGRLCEVFGPKTLPVDQSHRRLGMTEAANLAVTEILKDPMTANACKAYTDGVNEYIATLNADEFPLEYKLLDYKPEKWTLQKTALLLKYMSKDLAGYDQDFERTYVLATLGLETYQWMYPVREDSLSPIIPDYALSTSSAISLHRPADADSTFLHPQMPGGFTRPKPDEGNGSNNWAISGNKSQTGSPILCNDPHLRLTLPSIWYECQITTPDYSSYGVSIPGSPGIIIGFNDNIAYGMTNSMRDVMDYYSIKFKDKNRKEYAYNGKWLPSTMRIDTYSIKGANTMYDTVLSTHIGPVIYDRNFHGLRRDLQRVAGDQNYAVNWTANLPSNELKTFLMLMRARNYGDYRNAISNFTCPGQNFIFAARDGDIAITQQGRFPAKWKYQGEFVMEGTDSLYEWAGFIPPANLLTIRNPREGYVSSANQLPADPNKYPYFLGGDYVFERGYRINQVLNANKKFTVQDMMNLQFDNFNTSAHQLLPILFSRTDSLKLDNNEKYWWDELAHWDMHNTANSTGATVFEMMLDTLEYCVWNDEMTKSYIGMLPERNTLIQDLHHNLNFKCVDDLNTPQRETFDQILKKTMQKITPALQKLKQEQRLAWGKYKATGVFHFLDIKQNTPALSRMNLNVGGGDGIVNATKKNHSPSWRMIVSMTSPIEAWGVYPGGENGHPGNPYYDTGIQNWSQGKYFKLWMMKQTESKSNKVKRSWICTP